MKKNLSVSKKKRISAGGILFLLLVVLFTFQLPTVFGFENASLQDGKKIITGVVTDANSGEALPGVTVLVKGTTSGAITDIGGNYSISASADDYLVFSFVGYLSEEVLVGEQTVISSALAIDLIGIDEVVVIGYGVQKKKLVTGATSQVKGEELLSSRSNRLESSLQGLTPGMVIVKQSGQPGSDYNITIRGIGSVNGTTPLVLIDGVPGNLNTLNPSDVESVDILKDAASAAIYGSRGGNGVILITTRKGKSGAPQLSYDFYYGVSNAPKKIDLLNAKEYATLSNEAQFNMFPARDPLFSQDYINSLGEGTDWQEEAYHKNAPSVNHYLGITGGNEYSTYSASVSYTKEDGIFDYNNKSYFERMGFRLNSEHKVKNYLRIGENMTYTHRARHGLGVTGIYDNFLRTILSASPLIEAHDPSVFDGFGRSAYIEDQVNPLAVMNYYYNEIKRNDDIVGDIYGEFEPIKGLKFRSDFGMALNFANNSTATDSFTITSQNYNEIPDYKQYMERKFGYNWDNVISFERSFGQHNLIAMVGTNSQDNWYFNMDVDINAFLQNPNLAPVPSNIVLQPGIVGDTIIYKGDIGKGVSRFSVFGRISYNYNEMYLATISLRRDGSSRFGENYRYKNFPFPAVSLGYVITKSEMLNSLGWLDFLKIRGSWGQNGTEPDRDYRYLATVGSYSRSYVFGSGRVAGISPDIMANPNLKWESSEQINIGFDSRFLRFFDFTFDWYKKSSKDWIVPITVPTILGGRGISNTPPYANAGNVINSGVEMVLGYRKNINNFGLDLSGNLAYNKNKVTDVPGDIIHGSTSVLYNGSSEFYRVEEGFPIGYFWGYTTDGLFQTQEEVDAYTNGDGDLLQPNAAPGDVRRVDVNGDGEISDDDKGMIGDPNPDFIYGVNATLNYKGFDFSLNISGQAGNQIVKCYRFEERAYFNYTTEILDRWTGPGTSNRIPRVTGGADRNQNWRTFSDLYIEDAGFMKIKSVSLGYDLKTIFKVIPMEQFRIYFSATNLLTLTKYTGLDPEVGYGSYYNSAGLLTDAYASGVDLGFYPAARSYLVGVNIKF
jgi:TonB-dependent starch-binding outer membrane protein SusC